MKVKVTLIVLVLMMALLTGCGNDNGNKNNDAGNVNETTAPTATAAATADSTADSTADVVSSASIVNTEEAFLNAISANGTWIIAITEDLTIDKDLLLEGEYKNGKKDDAGKDIIQRKVALYSQDEERNITARYTLTAPKLTVTSPEASIQHGTFKGDLYISVSNFKLIDATVDGNVYFTTDEAKKTFAMEENSKVTGKQELKKD